MSAGLLATAWLLAGIVAVRTSQQGVVLRFGAPRPIPLMPGIHWAPFGIDRVVKVEVTKTETVPIGFRTAEGGRTTTLSADEGQWLTGDTNILAVELAVQYRVVRPVEWVVNGRDTQEQVRRAAESIVTDAMGRLPVDDALTAGRLTLLEEVRRGTQELLEDWQSGVGIVSVAIRSVDPPPAVLAAFQDVQNAKSDRERFVNEAESYANDTLPRARGEAGALVSAAASQRQRRVEEALRGRGPLRGAPAGGEPRSGAASREALPRDARESPSEDEGLRRRRRDAPASRETGSGAGCVGPSELTPGRGAGRARTPVPGGAA